MKNLFLSLLFPVLLLSCSTAVKYPSHWWEPVTDKNPPVWEILPEAGEKGKTLILSKRNELGILSNFAPTPIKFEGKTYPGLEGLWQSMKYPEGPRDPRSKLKYKLKREQVEMMSAFEAKRAGKEGSSNMKKLGINWVTYKGRRMKYRTSEKGEHYKLIRKLMVQKIIQNKEVQKVLLSTGNLILLPDHKQDADSPPAWKYNQIWMEIREQIKTGIIKL